MLRAGECNCLPSHKEESFAVHQEETMFQFFPTKKPLDLLWLLSDWANCTISASFLLYSLLHSALCGLVRTGTYPPRARVSESTRTTVKLGITLTSAHSTPRGEGTRTTPNSCSEAKADNGRHSLMQPLQAFSWKACFTQITNELKSILKNLSVDWKRSKENPWRLSMM